MILSKQIEHCIACVALPVCSMVCTLSGDGIASLWELKWEYARTHAGEVVCMYRSGDVLAFISGVIMAVMTGIRTHTQAKSSVCTVMTVFCSRYGRLNRLNSAQSMFYRRNTGV